LALHRAQLVELDRDLADGQIAPAEHANAVLEVQRRLLAVADTREETPSGAATAPLLTALIAVPAAAFALYIVGGSPYMPSVRHADAVADLREQQAQDAAIIAQLRAGLSKMDPRTDTAREGYVLLGNAEASRGNMPGAADAWRTALSSRFDPTLAVETAEAITEAAGHVTDESAALFRRALAEAPPDAPWRPMAEKRIAGVK
jgi:cytochrome c-type biogenesis protein CcmH